MSGPSTLPPLSANLPALPSPTPAPAAAATASSSSTSAAPANARAPSASATPASSAPATSSAAPAPSTQQQQQQQQQQNGSGTSTERKYVPLAQRSERDKEALSLPAFDDPRWYDPPSPRASHVSLGDNEELSDDEATLISALTSNRGNKLKAASRAVRSRRHLASRTQPAFSSTASDAFGTVGTRKRTSRDAALDRFELAPNLHLVPAHTLDSSLRAEQAHLAPSPQSPLDLLTSAPVQRTLGPKNDSLRLLAASVHGLVEGEHSLIGVLEQTCAHLRGDAFTTAAGALDGDAPRKRLRSVQIYEPPPPPPLPAPPVQPAETIVDTPADAQRVSAAEAPAPQQEIDVKPVVAPAEAPDVEMAGTETAPATAPVSVEVPVSSAASSAAPASAPTQPDESSTLPAPVTASEVAAPSSAAPASTTAPSATEPAVGRGDQAPAEDKMDISSPPAAPADATTSAPAPAARASLPAPTEVSETATESTSVPVEAPAPAAAPAAEAATADKPADAAMDTSTGDAAAAAAVAQEAADQLADGAAVAAKAEMAPEVPTAPAEAAPLASTSAAEPAVEQGSQAPAQPPANGEAAPVGESGEATTGEATRAASTVSSDAEPLSTRRSNRTRAVASAGAMYDDGTLLDDAIEAHEVEHRRGAADDDEATELDALEDDEDDDPFATEDVPAYAAEFIAPELFVRDMFISTDRDEGAPRPQGAPEEADEDAVHVPAHMLGAPPGDNTVVRLSVREQEMMLHESLVDLHRFLSDSLEYRDRLAEIRDGVLGVERRRKGMWKVVRMVALDWLEEECAAAAQAPQYAAAAAAAYNGQPQ